MKEENNNKTNRARSKTMSQLNTKGQSNESNTNKPIENKPRSLNSNQSTSEIHQKNVQAEFDNTVAKVGEYFHSELLLASDDLTLLQNFNQETIKQFNKMSIVAQELIADGHKMNQAFSDFEPFLKQIDDISRQIDYLELVTNELDEYSFDLEEKVKLIKKRKELVKKNPPSSYNSNTGKR